MKNKRLKVLLIIFSILFSVLIIREIAFKETDKNENIKNNENVIEENITNEPEENLIDFTNADLKMVPFIENGQETNEIERLILNGNSYIDIFKLTSILNLETTYEDETVKIILDEFNTLYLSKNLIKLEVYPSEDNSKAANPETDNIDELDNNEEDKSTTSSDNDSDNNEYEESTSEEKDSIEPDVLRLTVPNLVIEYNDKIFVKKDGLFVNGFVTIVNDYVLYRNEFEESFKDFIEEEMYINGLMPEENNEKYEIVNEALKNVEEFEIEINSDLPMENTKDEDLLKTLIDIKDEDIEAVFGNEEKIIVDFKPNITEAFLDKVLPDNNFIKTNLKIMIDKENNVIYGQTYMIEFNSNVHIDFKISY